MNASGNLQTRNNINKYEEDEKEDRNHDDKDDNPLEALPDNGDLLLSELFISCSVCQADQQYGFPGGEVGVGEKSQVY